MLTVNVEAEFDPEILRRAIVHLEAAVKGDGKNRRYRRCLGEAYLAARRFETALDYLVAVHKERPEPRVAYLIAYTFFRLGDLDTAERYLEEATTEGALGFSRLHVLRGRVLYEKGEYRQAVNEFGRALVINPAGRVPRWHMARGLVAHASQLGGETVNLYRRALALLKSHEPGPDQEDELHRLLGRVYLALHHPVEALRHLEQAPQPDGNEKTLLLGIAYLLQGEGELATKCLAEAAQESELRRTCVDYLIEIATTPRDVLAAMGTAEGRIAPLNHLNEHLLCRIFGAESPELKRVLEAVSGAAEKRAMRTRAEAGPLLAGRLFAARDPGDADQDDPTQRVVVQTELLDESKPDDRLCPQTMLDVTEGMQAVPMANDAGEPDDESDEDDWDEALDEAMAQFTPKQESSPVARTNKLEIIDDESRRRPDDGDPPSE